MIAPRECSMGNLELRSALYWAWVPPCVVERGARTDELVEVRAAACS